MKMKLFNKEDLRRYARDRCHMNSREYTDELADKVRIETERNFCAALIANCNTTQIQKILQTYHQIINNEISQIY